MWRINNKHTLTLRQPYHLHSYLKGHGYCRFVEFPSLAYPITSQVQKASPGRPTQFIEVLHSCIWPLCPPHTTPPPPPLQMVSVIYPSFSVAVSYIGM